MAFEKLSVEQVPISTPELFCSWRPVRSVSTGVGNEFWLDRRAWGPNSQILATPAQCFPELARRVNCTLVTGVSTGVENEQVLKTHNSNPFQSSSSFSICASFYISCVIFEEIFLLVAGLTVRILINFVTPPLSNMLVFFLLKEHFPIGIISSFK